MPLNDVDIAYFAARAKQERQRAQNATPHEAHVAHLELAQLYEQIIAPTAETLHLQLAH